MSDPAGLVRLIESVRFTPTRLRAGYDMRQIDALLDELSRLAANQRPLAAAVPSQQPTKVALQQGYQDDEVRAFLDDLLRQAGEAGPAWLTEPPVAPGSTDTSAARDGGHRLPGREDPRGFVARLFGR